MPSSGLKSPLTTPQRQRQRRDFPEFMSNILGHILKDTAVEYKMSEAAVSLFAWFRTISSVRTGYIPETVKTFSHRVMSKKERCNFSQLETIFSWNPVHMAFTIVKAQTTAMPTAGPSILCEVMCFQFGFLPTLRRSTVQKAHVFWFLQALRPSFLNSHWLQSPPFRISQRFACIVAVAKTTSIQGYRNNRANSLYQFNPRSWSIGLVVRRGLVLSRGWCVCAPQLHFNLHSHLSRNAL